ncbi:MAG: DUF2066 domain-containing protein, partial [Methylococcales bacterium]
MNVLLRALLLCGLLIGYRADAAEVSGLYETEVLADSQTVADKNNAIRSALEKVLKKVLAGEGILQDPVVKSAIADAPRFVKQAQFSLSEQSIGANRTARTLRVLFDAQALLNVLKTSKLKVWEETRPETLLWLVLEDNGRRSFFRPETMYELNNAVNKMSKQAGLPLLLPLQDLDEQRQISVSDVLSAYPQRLLAVSERYGVVSILAGRVVKSADCWTADWAFYFDDRIVQTETPCASLEDAILTGMQSVYDGLSNYYAVKPYGLEVGSVTLKVFHADDMEDKNRLQNYLKSLPMVKSVSWVGGDVGQQRYKVSFNGERAALEEILGLGRVL